MQSRLIAVFTFPYLANSVTVLQVITVGQSLHREHVYLFSRNHWSWCVSVIAMVLWRSLCSQWVLDPHAC